MNTPNRLLAVRRPFALIVALALAVTLVPVGSATAAGSGGSISGTIRVEPAYQGQLVRAASIEEESGGDERTVYADAAGRYTIGDLAPGRYRVSLAAWDPTTGRSYWGEYYPGVTRRGDATLIEVGGQPVTGVDATLVAMATVEGLFGEGIAGLDDPAVALYPASWGAGMPDFTSDGVLWGSASAGYYGISVKPGSYRLAFGDRVDLPWPQGWDLEEVALRPGVVNVGAWQTVTIHGTGIQEFADVNSLTMFGLPIGWLATSNITTGYPDGTFRPAAPITRGAMAAFLYRMAGRPATAPVDPDRFGDVSTTHQFFTEIMWLVQEGITTGYPDSTFRPEDPVTREAMAAFLHRFAGRPAPAWDETFVDVPGSAAFHHEISWLASSGITTGYDDRTFRPRAAVTRDAMAAFLFRYWNKFLR